MKVRWEERVPVSQIFRNLGTDDVAAANTMPNEDRGKLALHQYYDPTNIELDRPAYRTKIRYTMVPHPDP